MNSTVGKVINCRAAVMWKRGETLSIENITVDPPKKGEVRVKMIATGICHSDAHVLWNMKMDYGELYESNPTILGHESTGIVESIGDGVSSVEVGDHVVLLWLANCEHCQLCLNPQSNLCAVENIVTSLAMSDGTSRVKCKDKSLCNFMGSGGFSEYQVLRETSVAKIPKSVPLDKVCTIGCAVGTGYGSAINLAKVHSGSTCAIWGLGAIGLSVALGCKASGAKRIIGIDINSDKFEIAKKFGCNEFINPNELDKPLEEILKSTGGVDYGFDCVGNASVINTALESLIPSGTLILIGIGPKDSVITIPSIRFLLGLKTVGGLFGGYKPKEGVQYLIREYLNGKLQIDDLITHHIKLDEVNEGFELLKKGKSIRSVIHFDK